LVNTTRTINEPPKGTKERPPHVEDSQRVVIRRVGRHSVTVSTANDKGGGGDAA
jgi:hypothetical protein